MNKYARTKILKKSDSCSNKGVWIGGIQRKKIQQTQRNAQSRLCRLRPRMRSSIQTRS